jgi:hypothetical protein
MAARLGLQIAQEEMAALFYSDSSRETEATAANKPAGTKEEIMSEVQMSNIVRAVQDAAAYPVRVRATHQAGRERRRTLRSEPRPIQLQSAMKKSKLSMI